MRRLLYVTCFLIIAFTTNTAAQDEALNVAEQMPSFPGGELAIYKYLQEHVKYPEAEKTAGISGKCYISFVVETDSTITNVKLLKGINNGPGCDAEAMRVVASMPKWIPGKQGGKPVRVSFTLPVKFTLMNKKVAPGTERKFGFRSKSASLRDTIFLTATSVECARADADYYRIATELEGAYLVKEIDFKTNLPRSIFTSYSLDSLVKNGKCSYYIEGRKRSEGSYENDKRKDIWTIWERNLPDSMVVDCNVNGTYRYMYVPAAYPMNAPKDTWYPIEVMPKYPGGESAMMQIIVNNVQYPKYERKHNIQGTCYVTFVVEKDGSMTDIHVLRGVYGGPGCDKEALRVANLMADWIPGTQFGLPVRVQFNLPIKFRLR